MGERRRRVDLLEKWEELARDDFQVAELAAGKKFGCKQLFTANSALRNHLKAFIYV